MGIEQYFAGMDRAPMFGTGQYFSEGNFRVRTKSLKVNNGFKGVCFIAEFDVLDSSSAKDPTGSTRSWVVKMGPTNKNAFSDIKSLIFAIVGVDPKKAGSPEENPELHRQAAELVKAACDADYAKQIGMAPNALEGREVLLQTFAKATRPTPEKPQGGTFTVHSWLPMPAAPQAAAS